MVERPQPERANPVADEVLERLQVLRGLAHGIGVHRPERRVFVERQVFGLHRAIDLVRPGNQHQRVLAQPEQRQEQVGLRQDIGLQRAGRVGERARDVGLPGEMKDHFRLRAFER
jgi:hypothetical protein